MLTSIKNATHALRDHLWTAWDVAWQASWYGVPQLVDLLAGGQRQGFNESPDSFYSLGFINIQSDTKWLINILHIGAFYTVVSLHSKNKQKSFEWLSDEGAMGERCIELHYDTLSENGINTEDFKGLCQIMVRQYFSFPVDTSNLPFPILTLDNISKQRKLPHFLPCWVVAGSRFLIWRLKPLMAIKYLQFRLGKRFPRNTFLSFDDIAQLWKGGNDMVTKMGIRKFRYLFCYYDLKPGESMQICYDVNDSRYFAFALNHMWLQLLKKSPYVTHVNSYQLNVKDNQYKITVTHQPTQQDNTLYTLGNRNGLIGFREIFPSKNPGLPKCKIIKLR